MKKTLTILSAFLLLLSAFVLPIPARAEKNPFAYSLADGGAVITKYSGKSKNIKVPATLDG
jgi:hypothetical protein